MTTQDRLNEYGETRRVMLILCRDYLAPGVYVHEDSIKDAASRFVAALVALVDEGDISRRLADKDARVTVAVVANLGTSSKVLSPTFPVDALEVVLDRRLTGWRTS